MFELWNNEIPFPDYENLETVQGIEYIDLHTAIDGEYQFALGNAIIKYNGVFYASWANSWRNENDNNTIVTQKNSYDGGYNWVNKKQITRTDEGYGRSHGVYFEYNNTLYFFCAKATFETSTYKNLRTEVYVLNDDDEFESLGIIADSLFWPMCEPLCLDDGSIIMAGLTATTCVPWGYGKASVARCNGKDLTKWEVTVLPDEDQIMIWGESTILKNGNMLIAIIRAEFHDNAIVSYSKDNGISWTSVEESNFPASWSKLYAGTLSSGKNYIVFNLQGRNRDTLVIATGYGAFDKVQIIRDGFDALPKYWDNNEWCYPYAFEDAEQKKLFVTYAKNKEDCEIAIIPLENL